MLRESGNEKTNDFKNDKNENVQMMRKYQPQMNLVWIRQEVKLIRIRSYQIKKGLIGPTVTSAT